MTHQEQRLYWVWGSMVQRCHNPKNKNFHNYGGRGILVCDRWREFGSFKADMGYCPAGFTIDRIDNDKGYSPGNCKWVPRQVNNENKRVYRGNAFGISGVEPVPYDERKYKVRIRHKGKIVLTKTVGDFFEACCIRMSAVNSLRAT